MPEEEIEQNEDELNQQAPETVSEEDAQAAFSAGFAKIRQLGDAVPQPKAETPTPPQAETPEPEPTEPAEPEPEPQNTEIEKYQKRIDKLEGRIGNLIQQVGSLSATQTLAAKATEKKGGMPSPERIQAALKNGKELTALQEEYPSFKPMVEEIQAIRIEGGKGVSKEDLDLYVEIATQNAVRTIENAQLEKVHPTWADDVKTEDFHSYSLEGGPTRTEWQQFGAINQENPRGAQNIVHTWKGLYPEWWNDKGRLMFSDRPSDTLELMNGYKGRLAPPAAPAQDPAPQNRDKSRLRKAASRQGVAEIPSSTISDEEAFKRGFARARGH
jgi:hypothetical protein